jgi:Predicted transcriptional regulators
MSGTRFMISDTAKQVEVEAHVLRYWEEELELKIARTEMGHRYYTRENIQLFKNIKELKEQGFQLKAIKILLPELDKVDSDDLDSILKLRDELNGKVFTDAQGDKKYPEAGTNETDAQMIPSEISGIVYEGDVGTKMHEFQMIIGNIISQVIKENNKVLVEGVGNSVSDKVTKEMDHIMVMREERDKERFRRLDETIRIYQRTRRQVAVSNEEQGIKTRKKGFFRRRKRDIEE